MKNEEKKTIDPNESLLSEDTNDYTLTNVPEHARKPWLPIFIVLLGFTFLSTSMAAGAAVSTAFYLKDLGWILLIGSGILATYTAVLCYISAKSGLSSVLLAKYALGDIGSKWADLLLGGTQVFWYGFQTAYLGLVFCQGLGLMDYYLPITIAWGIITGITALKGTRGMEIISYISFPAFIYIAFKVPVMSVQTVGGWSALASIEPSSSMAFIAALTTVIGTFISGGTNATNWARFAKTPRQAFSAGWWSFFLGTVVMVGCGMFGGLAFQSDDMVKVLFELGIIIMGVIVLVLNIWTTNASTAYAFGVAGAEFFGKEKKEPYVIGGVLIGTVMAAAGIFDVFLPFLIVMGVFIPPMGGLIMGDYLLNWRKGYPHISNLKFQKVRRSNLIAYLLATGIAFLTNKLGWGIPTLNGAISAIILVFVVDKIFTALNIDDRNVVVKE